MESFVSRDELVGESKSRHESSLLEPEDGGERSCERQARLVTDVMYVEKR